MEKFSKRQRIGMVGRWKFILGGTIVIAALAWLGFVGFQESKAYYITVDEYASMAGDLQGKTVRIAGEVVPGSVDRTKSRLEFVIKGEKDRVKIHYVGTDVVPDTFKGGSKALVEGNVAGDGTFEARHIEAKCASKYEAEYQKRTTS